MAMSGCELENIDPVDYGETCQNVARSVSVADDERFEIYCAGSKDETGFCDKYMMSGDNGLTEEEVTDVSIILPLNSLSCPAEYQCLQILGENICLKSKCNGQNVNIYLDRKNCGACNNDCGNGQTCENGFCVAADVSKVFCDGKWIDPETSAEYCGAMGDCSGEDANDPNRRGKNCAADPIKRLCSNGSCVEGCPNGQSACMNTCVSLGNENIASCDGSIVTCKTGDYEQCDETVPKCMDLSANPQHCGACNTPCSEGEVCILGECVVNECSDETQSLCYVGGEKTCIAIYDANENHCGACNFKCSEHTVSNAVAKPTDSCVGGMCRYECVAGYINAGISKTKTINGNEVVVDDTADAIRCVDANTDPNNCGGKGIECADNEVCLNGECIVNSCDGTDTLCYINGQNICKNTQIDDANHCGTCNYDCAKNPIANATSSKCEKGKCQYECASGYNNVGTAFTADTIRCVDFNTDNNNCGEKGKRCDAGRTCVAKKCACPEGQVYCGGTNDAGGKCIVPETDAKYCGANAACNIFEDCAKNNQVCIAGTCRLNSCNNKSETLCQTTDGYKCININATDLKNCGACGLSCDALKPQNAKTSHCAKGVCHYNCLDGFRNIGTDFTLTNIKCINPSADYNNCGELNGELINCAKYPGTTCIGGKCVISCPTGQIACKDKCIDPLTDAKFCGAKAGCAKYIDCTKDATKSFCSGGECVASCPSGTSPCGNQCLDFAALHIKSCTSSGSIACVAGYANTDGVSSNGCETNTNTDIEHCGQKQINCAKELRGSVCQNGQCVCLPPATKQCRDQCLDWYSLHIDACDDSGNLECMDNYADVDGKIENGCEVNTFTDNEHCGKDQINCLKLGQVCFMGACRKFI